MGGKQYKRESDFQADLIREIKVRFPGSIVLKNDANYKEGIPDLSVFYQDRWAMLECKVSENAHKQPGQDYYISLANEMSFGSFISPENKEEVLDELERSFKTCRKACTTKS